MSTFNIDIVLILLIHDMAINVEINVEDNQIPQASKRSNDSTLTNVENDTHSSSTSRVNVERMQNSTND